MKREFLKAFELSDDAIDLIMAENGRDIEKFKTELGELDGLKAQLEDTEQQLQCFKEMDIEGIKKAADDWKAKAEKAQADSAAEISALRFDHALSGALAKAKAKNAKVVKALLNMDNLRLENGEIVGLNEQLSQIKLDNDYLFEGDGGAVSIVKPTRGGQFKSITKEDFSKMTYMEKYKLKTEQPDIYRVLSGK